MEKYLELCSFKKFVDILKFSHLHLLKCQAASSTTKPKSLSGFLFCPTSIDRKWVLGIQILAQAFSRVMVLGTVRRSVLLILELGNYMFKIVTGLLYSSFIDEDLEGAILFSFS